jgi:putative sigma-54 modulation protein
MQISITARHCELDPEIRLGAEQRLRKLDRFARDLREAHLVITVEKFRHTAEITARLNQHELVSREASDEPRIAIEQAADRLEQQLRRLKERRIDHRQRADGARGAAPDRGAGTGTDGAWDDEG